MIVVDELAYVSPEFLLETVFPVLEVKDCALLGISTPLDEFNFFSKLLVLKDVNNDSFFHVVRIGAVCDDCKKLSMDKWFSCNHKIHELPKWKSGPKHIRMKRVYEMTGHESMALRENAGEVASDYTPAFSRDKVSALFSEENLMAKPFRLVTPPDLIVMSVDPAGGGRSGTAIVSMFYYAGSWVVSEALVSVYVVLTSRCAVNSAPEDCVDAAPRFTAVVPVFFRLGLCTTMICGSVKRGAAPHPPVVYAIEAHRIKSFTSEPMLKTLMLHWNSSGKYRSR